MGTGGGGGLSQQHQQQQQTRTKRMRTSFKHHQLRTMKSYFNINQNPDAKDLKQLAQKTGLSKRVLQVRRRAARTCRHVELADSADRRVDNCNRTHARTHNYAAMFPLNLSRVHPAQF